MAVATVATVATVGAPAVAWLSLSECSSEAAFMVKSRATTTKPENEQEVFEPEVLCPACKLVDLLGLQGIRAPSLRAD